MLVFHFKLDRPECKSSWLNQEEDMLVFHFKLERPECKSSWLNQEEDMLVFLFKLDRPECKSSWLNQEEDVLVCDVSWFDRYKVQEKWHCLEKRQPASTATSFIHINQVYSRQIVPQICQPMYFNMGGGRATSNDWKGVRMQTFRWIIKKLLQVWSWILTDSLSAVSRFIP